jgi:hypothetical protein
MAFANSFFLRNREREDDSTDHVDSDTPSGRATPQPDPSDKRLPGINHNSYFGQVGAGSSTRRPSSGPRSDPLQTHDLGSGAQSPASVSPRGETVNGHDLMSVAPDSQPETASGCPENGEEAVPFLAHERPGLPSAPAPPRALHPYPTPPVSQTPSLYKLKLSDGGSEEAEHGARNAPPTQRKSIPEAASSISRRGSFVRRASLNPLSSIVTTSNVHAAHFSNPSGRNPVSIPSTPIISSSTEPDFLHESASIELLKRLTDDASRKKSIPPTPTRASSNAAASDASGVSDPAQKKSSRAPSAEIAAAQASTATATVESVKSPKGKLTVKIAGARGLRRSKDPYVVAVFQRNELVSGGPRDQGQDETEDSTSSPAGGIPIMRSASDSGRAMAIPMKSRQSSNNSSSDHRDFKKATSSPTWDTEAVL